MAQTRLNFHKIEKFRIQSITFALALKELTKNTRLAYYLKE